MVHVHAVDQNLPSSNLRLRKSLSRDSVTSAAMCWALIYSTIHYALILAVNICSFPPSKFSSSFAIFSETDSKVQLNEMK